MWGAIAGLARWPTGIEQALGSVLRAKTDLLDDSISDGIWRNLSSWFSS